MKRTILATALAFSLSLGLVACGSEDNTVNLEALNKDRWVEVTTTSNPEGEVIVVDDEKSENLYTDLNGNEVNMDNVEYAGHTPAQIQQVTDYGAEADKFSIPEAGLRVNLGTMRSYNNVIEPVGFTHAYIVSDYSPGYHDPNAGSMMIVAHALDGQGLAPGNYVWNNDAQATTVAISDTIRAAGREYSITATEVIGKNDTPNLEYLWSNPANTLFFVTCVPHQGKNLIITAELIPTDENMADSTSTTTTEPSEAN